jgi:hypothetical protein
VVWGERFEHADDAAGAKISTFAKLAKLIDWRATGLYLSRMTPTAPTSSEAEQILALIDVLPDVFLFVKDRASRFVRANRAFLVMHGCRSNADVVGRTDHDFHPPAMATQYVAAGIPPPIPGPDSAERVCRFRVVPAPRCATETIGCGVRTRRE